MNHHTTQHEWETFRRAVETTHTGDDANLYRMKTRDILHWGPHAVLVRDVLINPERFESVDYLNTPEIVEDISFCFRERTNAISYRHSNSKAMPVSSSSTTTLGDLTQFQ